MRLLNFTLDDSGNPVPCTNIKEWAEWFERADRHVANTDLGPLGHVSTVFLGIDHGVTLGDFDFDPLLYKPVLWETMCFGGPLDQEQWRYKSADAARRHHAEIVSYLTAPALMVRYRELKGLRRPTTFIRWQEPREGKEYVRPVRLDLAKLTKAVKRRFRKDEDE